MRVVPSVTDVAGLLEFVAQHLADDRLAGSRGADQDADPFSSLDAADERASRGFDDTGRGSTVRHWAVAANGRFERWKKDSYIVACLGSWPRQLLAAHPRDRCYESRSIVTFGCGLPGSVPRLCVG